MCNNRLYTSLAIVCMLLFYTACKIPALVEKKENTSIPSVYNGTADSSNSATIKWKSYFTDPNLRALIDTALNNNQELNILSQEVDILRNEIRARKGEYLPFVGIRAGAGLDKAARYTNIGAMEENTEIKPGKEMPDPLPDYLAAAYATWEIDVWHKLHNAKKAAVNRFLSSVEGKNFAITNLVAEIANSYYELLALDNQLDILSKNIAIQTNVLKIVKLQKEATRVTELAVRKFEAQVLSTQSLQYELRQKITETENRINFLLGRYPQPIVRNDSGFNTLLPPPIHTGLPSQLLTNRPDIRKAEQELAAAKLDVKVARARFYPSVGISASIGYQAFNPAYLIKTPASILFNLAGELVAPLINRNAIISSYQNANDKQVQAVYDYERTVLNAYIEVANLLAKMDNLGRSYNLKSQAVVALTRSVDISNDLFGSARADYMEVLMTQRDALESKFELVENRKEQMNAVVNIYRALGGGWN